MFMYIYCVHYKLILVNKVITKDKKMNNNAGSCKIVKFKEMQEVDTILSEFAENFFEVIELNFCDDGREQLVGYMRNDCDESDLISAAKNMQVKLPEFNIEVLHSDNWLADNVIKFNPVEVAEFHIYGIHEKERYNGDKIGIRVYAATAFGSEHQTTKCCLQAVYDIFMYDKQIKNILDVGTGSGILAIASAKLWPQAKIIAVDIDDESVIVAQANAEDNKVEEQITTAYSDGYEADIVCKNAPYDLILANILARPLIAMAADMAKNLHSGGYAVISGFVDEQKEWVINEHAKYGLKLKKIYQEDNWCAALLKKD